MADAAEAAAAPARLLDQPVLPGPQPAPDACSLREELRQLAAGCCEGQPGESDAGFVGLRELAAPGAPAALAADLHGHLAAPQPVSVVAARPRPALPAFLLQAFGDAAPPAGGAAAVGQQPAPSKAGADCLFSLEMPVLPVAGMTRGTALVAGAPTAAFAHLFQPLELPAPAPPAAACLAPRGCIPASLAALLAADMQLDGAGLVLPPVELPEEEEAPGGSCVGSRAGWEASDRLMPCLRSAQALGTSQGPHVVNRPHPHQCLPSALQCAARPLLALIQEECGCRPANTAHLALHLDW